MPSIQEIRKYFHQRSLAQSEQQLHIKRNSVDFKQAKNIGLLFDGTTLEQREIVLKYVSKLEKQGKKVTLLGYVNLPKPQENLTFRHYSNQEINWKLEPQSELIEEFKQKVFDVLLVLGTPSNLQFEHISTLSKAKFRVGPFSENTNAYDLFLDTSDTEDLTTFIQQLEKYLQKTTTQI